MSGRVVFFLQKGTYEPAFQAASMGVTAAAMGDQVYFVVSFEALRHLHRGSFGMAHSEKEVAEFTRAEGLGLPQPAKMLEEARALGAKVVACDTTVKLCGMSAEELSGKLDEVMGMASLWRLTEGARTVSI